MTVLGLTMLFKGIATDAILLRGAIFRGIESAPLSEDEDETNVGDHVLHLLLLLSSIHLALHTTVFQNNWP